MTENYQMMFGAGIVLIPWFLGVSLIAMRNAFSNDDNEDKVDFLFMALIALFFAGLTAFVMFGLVDNLLDG